MMLNNDWTNKAVFALKLLQCGNCISVQCNLSFFHFRCLPSLTVKSVKSQIIFQEKKVHFYLNMFNNLQEKRFFLDFICSWKVRLKFSD